MQGESVGVAERREDESENPECENQRKDQREMRRQWEGRVTARASP